MRVCFGNMRPCQWRLQQLLQQTHRGICRMSFYGRGWCFSTALHKIMPPFSINTPSKFRASKHSFHIFVRLCVCVCVRLKSHTYCMAEASHKQKRIERREKKLKIDSDVTVYVECMLVLFVLLTCLIRLELDSLLNCLQLLQLTCQTSRPIESS